MPETQTAASPASIMPLPSKLTRFFWDGAKEGRLLLLNCRNCGKFVHLPREICRYCQSFDLAPKQVSGKAKLYTWSIATQAFLPWFADKLPYTIAVVELPEQARLHLVTNIVDCPEEKLRGDMPVEVVFREAAPGFAVPMFRPAGA